MNPTLQCLTVCELVNVTYFSSLLRNLLHRQSPVGHYTKVDAGIKEVASLIIDSFITCKPVSSQLSLTECTLKSLMGCSDWGFGDNEAVVPT